MSDDLEAVIDSWERPVKRSKSKLGKQFKSWQISKAVVTRRQLTDSESFYISVMVGTVPITNDWFKLVSGCEIYLKREPAKMIEEMAKLDDGLMVSFFIKIPRTLTEINHDFQSQLEESRKLSLEELRERLKTASPTPPQRQVFTTVFRRNADVVAFVLRRANGRCEECGKDARFLRIADGSPYLEVHHVKMLAHGGDDAVENAIALCPNCHRRRHYGRQDAYL